MYKSLHLLSLPELRAYLRTLETDKRPRGKLKRLALILACNAWINRRRKEAR